MDPAQATCEYLVLTWAEELPRLLGRLQDARSEYLSEERRQDRSCVPYPEDSLSSHGRAVWAAAHQIVLAAYQLERWVGRLATERGESTPIGIDGLRVLRDALEHLNDAELTDTRAESPPGRQAKGRALRILGGLDIDVVLAGPLFGRLDLADIEHRAVEALDKIMNRRMAEEDSHVDYLLSLDADD